MQELVFRSCAKINLYLDVLNRRRDGYHNIETVFQTVSLADTLRFAPCDIGIHLECNHPDVPADERNIVHKAAVALLRLCDGPRGVDVRIEKRIPVAAGLAGGSGNAAATLVALNDLWDLRLPRHVLHAIGATLGADVPYCIEGGTMAATLRGDALAPLPPLPETWLVLVHPPIALSTAAVYQSPALKKSNQRPFAGRTAAFRRAVAATAAGDLPRAVFNRMETAAFALYPELAGIKAELLRVGCIAAAMSGSGPTLFGLCESESAARGIAAALAPRKSSVVKTVAQGVEILM